MHCVVYARERWLGILNYLVDICDSACGVLKASGQTSRAWVLAELVLMYLLWREEILGR